jgi:NhaP-type Na+/H+ or K+/H+ antiporter
MGRRPVAQILNLATALLAHRPCGHGRWAGSSPRSSRGWTFGHIAGAHELSSTLFAEEAGDLLAAVVWIGSGALALGPVLRICGADRLYSILSLTVVRMLPVAVSMFRTAARPPTVAFIGWFGPRGLASLVFALLAIEADVPDARMLFLVVTCTVALSVVAHGLTSAPFIRLYHRWYVAAIATRPDVHEANPAETPRARGLPSPAETPVPRD